MDTDDLKSWFGILALIVIELGLITLRVGLNVFIADFLKNWLRKYILVVDMDYKALLTAHRASGGALQVLTDEIIRTLKASHGLLSPGGVERVRPLPATFACAPRR